MVEEVLEEDGEEDDCDEGDCCGDWVEGEVVLCGWG